MIDRIAEKEAFRLSKQYPVLTIVGPRQSGKTTICKKVFPDYAYVSLEDIEDRNLASEDPKSFLNRFKEPVIIDEIQRVPSILSYIQTRVDSSKRNGSYILTGSQQFELMETLSQSLAGRTAILKLLPLTIKELTDYWGKTFNIEEYLYSGFYPRVYDQNLNPTEASSFYLSTYVERDIRNLINVKDYLQFERFLKVCASRTAQTVNLTSIGNECGLSHNTVNNWLSLLEASFILYRVPPHFRNFSKRIIKAPKLFFYDVGFASFLLGIESKDHLAYHPLKGALFETMVMSELLKGRYNAIKTNNLFFFRDNSGHEVDCLLDRGSYCVPVEIKSSQTINESFFDNLMYYNALQNNSVRPVLVYGGDESYSREAADIISFKELHKIEP
jgi:predicted AAA+ superfamily ATPase